MRHSRCRPLAAVLVTAAFFSFCVMFHSLWIPVKAEAAQWLIQFSWQRVLQGSQDARPWPWADTQAAARLTVPTLNQDLLVLQGNSGRNLAFGPAFSAGSEALNDMVISGHRDTHFQFLQHLQSGDLIRVEKVDGTQWFRVNQAEIVDSSKVELVLDPGKTRLSLVTCYPFDAPRAGGDLRYVVTALPAEQPFSLRSASSG